MDEYYPILEQSPLFEGIGREEFVRMAGCLAPRIQLYEREDVIHQQGEQVSELGLILSGGIEAVRTLPDGRSVIQAVMGPGEMFGEVLASSVHRLSPVRVWARARSRILFFSHNRLVAACSSACPCHIRLIENMLRIMADKYFSLSERMGLLMRKGMREKIACYLLDRRETAAADTFDLELDRRELADYLGVDRSAMCRELSRMKADGLMDYYRESFRLLDREGLRRAAAPR